VNAGLRLGLGHHHQARNQLGTPAAAKSFLRGARIFWTMSNSFQRYAQHIFPGEANNFARGASLPPAYALGYHHQSSTLVPRKFVVSLPSTQPQLNPCFAGASDLRASLSADWRHWPSLRKDPVSAFETICERNCAEKYFIKTFVLRTGFVIRRKYTFFHQVSDSNERGQILEHLPAFSWKSDVEF